MGRDHFTVLGASGFIGGALVSDLREGGVSVNAPSRAGINDFSELKGSLGHIVYTIGLTSDFRVRPFDTVEAHVGLLSRVLQSCDFESLTYLSSTRVYIHSASTREDHPVIVNPNVPEDLFNLSKLAGEALCLASGRAVRIARVSNVYGEGDLSENFLTSVLRDAAASGRVKIGLSPASSKDYVDLRDVVRWLTAIATRGTRRVYNVASGRNTSNGEIAQALVSLGIDVAFDEGGRTIAFPPIDVEAIAGEFGNATNDVVDRIPALLAGFRHRT